MVEYGVRRTGDGVFYLVTLDENGDAHDFYSNGALVKFDSSHEAKDYTKGGISDIPPKKRRF